MSSKPDVEKTPEEQAREEAATKAASERAMELKKNELVSVIAPSAFLTVISGGMLFTARQAVAIKQFDNATQMATFFSRLGSAGALFEFIANPIFGKMADAYGRRPMMPVANTAVAIVRLLLFLQPKKLWPIVLEQAISIPLVTSFFSTYRATLGDHLTGAQFADANAKIGMSIGLSLVAGPLIAKVIMNRGDPKYCYLISSILSTVSLVNLHLKFKESLPADKKQPIDLSDMQPFSFMQLLKHSVLRKLMLITGMQSFSEGRNITDFLTIYLQSEIKWTWDKINNFVSLYGIALILSGLTVKPMLSKLGLRHFTSFSNLCNGSSLLAYARFPPLNFIDASLAMYLGVIFGSFGGRKRDAAESLIMKLGNEKGFGNGFISGSMMNFRAIVNIIGPLMFGQVYAWGTKRKYPQALFVVAAATIVLAEMSLQSLTNKELKLDEKGQIIKEEPPQETSKKLS